MTLKDIIRVDSPWKRAYDAVADLRNDCMDAGYSKELESIIWNLKRLEGLVKEYPKEV